eukprot:3535383-Prymnesium_polylepis.1
MMRAVGGADPCRVSPDMPDDIDIGESLARDLASLCAAAATPSARQKKTKKNCPAPPRASCAPCSCAHAAPPRQPHPQPPYPAAASTTTTLKGFEAVDTLAALPPSPSAAIVPTGSVSTASKP